jgi:Txe/YoeB family toxin of Txe-Axe toxin-antitoxin module
MPDASDKQIDKLVKNKINDLLKNGYREFVFSEKPEPKENEKVLITFEEIDGKIVQKWTITPDIEHYKEQINKYIEELGASDYKIIKCFEAQLTGEEMPYDVKVIHAERKSIREKINRLEIKIKDK